MPGIKRRRKGSIRGTRKRVARGSSRMSYKGRRKTVRRRGGPSTAVIRQPSGLPDRVFVKLKYSTFLTLTSTTGQVNYNIFRGNSVYDPDLTGTGTEAYLAAWWLKSPTPSTTGGGYTNYRVLGSSIRVTGSIQPGANTASNVTVAVLQSTNSTGYGVAKQADIMANPYCKYKLLSGNGPSVFVLKKYMSTAKIYGETKQSIMDEDNYQATYQTSPTNGFYHHVYMWSTDQTANSNPVLMEVQIIYYCVLNNRNEINLV